MNKKIIIFSLVIGVLFTLYIYTKYDNEKVEKTLYFLQIGAYKNSENVTKATKLVNHNYIEKTDGIYYIYVAISSNKEVINKIKNIYEINGNEVYIKEKITNDYEFIEYLSNYDSLIKKITDEALIYELERDILNKYKEMS